MHKIETIYDNTKDGKPSYAIQTAEGKMFYATGVPLYPVPSRGDVIDCNIISTKTSEKGNKYSYVKDVQIVQKSDEGIKTPDKLGEITAKTNINGFKNNTQRLDIFVTGIVGRAMGSGQFSVHDIAELTKNAVSAFNENLKEL